MDNSYTPQKYRAYIRSLMFVIGGGAPRAGEKERWLEKVSGLTGIGVRSLRAAYDGEWISKNQYISNNTRQRLEAVAENARKTQTLVEFIELQLAIYEEAPDYFGRWRIALVRAFVDQLHKDDARRALDEVRRQEAERLGKADRQSDGAGTAAASAAAKRTLRPA